MEHSNLVPFDEGTAVLESPKASETPEVSAAPEMPPTKVASPEKNTFKKPSRLDSFSPAFKEPESTQVMKTVLWYGLVLGTMVVFALTFTVKRSTPSQANITQAPQRGLASVKKNVRVPRTRIKTSKKATASSLR